MWSASNLHEKGVGLILFGGLTFITLVTCVYEHTGTVGNLPYAKINLIIMYVEIFLQIYVARISLADMSCIYGINENMECQIMLIFIWSDPLLIILA